jgi:hypothetical protein
MTISLLFGFGFVIGVLLALVLRRQYPRYRPSDLPPWPRRVADPRSHVTRYPLDDE